MSDPGYDLARSLLEQLKLPTGTANAFFRQRGNGQLVVWLSNGAKLPPTQRPKTFRGVEVVYEKYPNFSAGLGRRTARR